MRKGEMGKGSGWAPAGKKRLRTQNPSNGTKLSSWCRAIPTLFPYTKRRNHAHGFHRRATTSPRRPPRHPLGWLKGRLFGPPPQGDPFFCARSDDAGCLRDGPLSGAQFCYATKSFRCPTRTEEALEVNRVLVKFPPPEHVPERMEDSG